MDIVKLCPAVKTPVWGGERIGGWGKKGCRGRIGETWELSFLESAPSVIDSGPDDGKPLYTVAGKSDWGSSAAAFGNFPVLIKFIDAAAPLSVQVHPGDEYAASHGLGFGKTEMWYVTDAAENAGLYMGFNRTVTAEEAASAAKNGSIEALLNFIPVKKGDCFFVEAGTVHAIGAGVTVAEIQQSSDVTFRVYDYGRMGADGKPRELHLNSALEVMTLEKYSPRGNIFSDGLFADRAEKLAECRYFSVYRAFGAGSFRAENSFMAFICVSGSGRINGLPMKKGDAFFAPAGKAVVTEGGAEFLIAGVNI